MGERMPAARTESNGMWGLFLVIVSWGLGKDLTPTSFMRVWMGVTARMLKIFVSSQTETFEEFESELAICLKGIGLETTAMHLNDAVSEQPDHVGVDGVPHRATATSNLTVRTPHGTVCVSQRLYLPVGKTSRDQIPTVGLLEARFGLIDKMTPRLAKTVARVHAEHPARRGFELLEDLEVGDMTQATFARKAGNLSHQLSATLDTHFDVVRHETEAPVGVREVVLSLDRVRLPFHEDKPIGPDGERPRHSLRTRRLRARKPLERKSPAPFEVKGRMVFVACATAKDEHGQTLSTFRYSIGHDGDIDELVGQLRADLHWIRRTNSDAIGVVIQDGERFLWKATDKGLMNEPNMLKCIDFYHFWEKAYPDLSVLCEGDETSLANLKKQCFNHRHADLHLLRYLDQWTHKPLTDEVHQAIVSLRTYLHNRPGLFDYKGHRDNNLTIGSGSIESTAKQVATARMRRSGQRWKAENATPMLKLRALFESRSHLDRLRGRHHRFQQVMTRWTASFLRQITLEPAIA